VQGCNCSDDMATRPDAIQSSKMLVFHVGYILDDKNTLCNDCNLNRMIGSYSKSSCNMDSVLFKSCD
jgi:hypothetical protein